MKSRAILLGTFLCVHALAAETSEIPVQSVSDVIELAKEHPNGVKVAVSFPIRKADVGSKGEGRGHLFLDSMEDYRDRRAVSVNIFPHSVEKLQLQETASLIGKTVTVHGLAKRALIRCRSGCPQDSKLDHYYQTQIFVREGDEVSIDEAASK